MFKVIIGNGTTLQIGEVARNVKIQMNGKEYEEQILGLIPELPDDFILGNIFLKRYQPFTIFSKGIILNNHFIPKLSESTIKNYKLVEEEKSEEKSNYQEKLDNWKNLISGSIPKMIQLSEEEESNLEEIKKMLSENWSENPQALWQKAMPEADIVLKNPDTVIRSKGISYPKEMIKEFKKQIQELLNLGLIRHSTSEHRSAAFMVTNHAEQVQGKARMVIDYKDLNRETRDDGYNLPNQEFLRNRIRRETPSVYSKFDLKSGYW
ncbi:uncharacterized protein LOC131162587 [Malania oleifera]|uniref:uncharacterized protein LOC131162587 n=1 Tax=Malania oleifera TaxID=397392 RepID=UPI0025AE12E8|nr:uncharacterized protein LOC131162587 [Malania oleifera]